jgi:hypothetical protein
VLSESALDQLRALRRQMNDAGAVVIGTFFPLNQSFFLQSVDCNADGTAGQPDLRANRVHRQRALVQQHFQNAEIG